MLFFFSDNTLDRNQEATAYTANNEINSQHQVHRALLPEEFPLPPTEDYFHPTTDMAGKARVSLDSPHHYEYPVFDKHHHNTYEEYSSFVYPPQNYPQSDYSHLTAEHQKYPFDGDHYHERHKTYDDVIPAEKLQMSPPSFYIQCGAKQQKYQSNGDDYYHNHLRNHIVSLSVQNEQMSPPVYHKNHAMNPYEYNKEYKEYNRSVLSKALPIDVSHLLQPNKYLKVNYFSRPEKHYIQGNPQEIYAPHELYADSEKHDNYFSQTVKRHVRNYPQNTFHTPLVVKGHAEPRDSSVLEYKEASPIGSVATTYVPFPKANMSSSPPNTASSQAENDNVTSNEPIKVIEDKNRLASAPNFYFDPQRYFRERY
jgi:hypothetical protein